MVELIGIEPTTSGLHSQGLLLFLIDLRACNAYSNARLLE